MEATVRLRLPETYFLSLGFSVADVPRAEAMRLVGQSSPSGTGVGVPIRWSLTPAGSQGPLISEAVESRGSYAFGQHEISRRVGSFLKPEPGWYRLRAEVTRDVPELARLPARLTFALHPKSSSSWQSALLIWGGLANAYLVAPASLLLGVLLAWRGRRAAFWASAAGSRESPLRNG